MTTDWVSESLGKVATLQRGFDLPFRLRKPGQFPIVTSSGIEGSHQESKVHGPGVVTGRYGTIGNVFYVMGDFWPLNTTLYVRDFHGHKPLYISYLLRTIDYHTHSGKSGVPGVNRNDLHEIIVSFPPTLAEQEAIAEALSDADALIESLEQLIAKKRHIKQGAMQELLTGKRRLPGFEVKPGYKQTEVGVIPEDWETVRLGQVSELSSGTTPARSMAERYYQDGSISWVKTLDLNNSKILATEERVTQTAVDETCLSPYPPGTVLVAMYGGFKQIGRTGLLCISATINQALTAVRPNRQRLNSEFLLCNLNYRVDYWKAVASSSRKDPNITSKDVRDFPIPLPPIAEQTAIATILSDMDGEIDSLEAKLSKAHHIKQGMMQELLTGRIRLV